MSNENIFYRMKIYFYRIRIFLSNENIFLSNENNFYRMQIYFYRMKIIFIEFCYISATIFIGYETTCNCNFSTYCNEEGFSSGVNVPRCCSVWLKSIPMKSFQKSRFVNLAFLHLKCQDGFFPLLTMIK